MFGEYCRLTLELVVAEPVAKIMKIVVAAEGYGCNPVGEGYTWCETYMYNWSNLGHRRLFRHWISTDKKMRFVLTKGFGSYINDEGRMRFVIALPGKHTFVGLPWLWTDFFQVTVCYED